MPSSATIDLHHRPAARGTIHAPRRASRVSILLHESPSSFSRAPSHSSRPLPPSSRPHTAAAARNALPSSGMDSSAHARPPTADSVRDRNTSSLPSFAGRSSAPPSATAGCAGDVLSPPRRVSVAPFTSLPRPSRVPARPSWATPSTFPTIPALRQTTCCRHRTQNASELGRRWLRPHGSPPTALTAGTPRPSRRPSPPTPASAGCAGDLDSTHISGASRTYTVLHASRASLVLHEYPLLLSWHSSNTLTLRRRYAAATAGKTPPSCRMDTSAHTGALPTALVAGTARCVVLHCRLPRARAAQGTWTIHIQQRHLMPHETTPFFTIHAPPPSFTSTRSFLGTRSTFPSILTSQGIEQESRLRPHGTPTADTVESQIALSLPSFVGCTRNDTAAATSSAPPAPTALEMRRQLSLASPYPR